jgi:hypothetical protein
MRFCEVVMARRIVVLIALLAMLVPARAGATPGFPPEIQAHLQLTYEPGCNVCHVGTPAVGDATTPFALTLISYGLVPNDNASLDAALDAIRAANVSSAGDGISDIQKLENDEDPNSFIGDGGGPVPIPFPPPDYGCQIGRVGASPSSVVASIAPLAAATCLRRRSKRRGTSGTAAAPG